MERENARTQRTLHQWERLYLNLSSLRSLLGARPAYVMEAAMCEILWEGIKAVLDGIDPITFDRWPEEYYRLCAAYREENEDGGESFRSN